MSELYDRVVKALVAAADQPVARGARYRHQYIVLHPTAYVALKEELGTPDIATQILQTPGSWLLGVDILCDEGRLPDQVTLKTLEDFD